MHTDSIRQPSLQGHGPRRWAAAGIARAFLVLACGGMGMGGSWGTQASAADAGDFLVLAETADGPVIALPSPAAQFGSFEEVSDAVTQERRRIAGEARVGGSGITSEPQIEGGGEGRRQGGGRRKRGKEG